MGGFSRYPVEKRSRSSILVANLLQDQGAGELHQARGSPVTALLQLRSMWHRGIWWGIVKELANSPSIIVDQMEIPLRSFNPAPGYISLHL